MKPVRTLVLLADDESARFLLNEGVGKGLSELSKIVASQFSDTVVEYADQRGRQTGGPGDVGRHGFEPSTSLERQSRERFVGHVMEALARQWKKLAPDRLVLAAAPKTLGELRARLTGAPAEALHADLAKDLIKIPARDLPRHFADILPM
ncbi:hypothetical protein DEA8626_02193 [Defluviimonas aquaemixtae]|uniref:Protein required for attachment to host cells n=1 Tax=Albidovulum aquaemixtae TaxID=1542388 RepID=A0A2R8B853_9RHOB|nr:host attachment protein [Defluviimonas aquaemixtae]SPH18653.1 hypothetical protein DEA8626_02193 [Defluviimonas aquaemixtae]